MQTYVFIVGTDGLPIKGIDVLQGASGEAHNEIQLGRTPRDEVEVVTDRDSRTLVDAFIDGPLQIWDLNGQRGSHTWQQSSMPRIDAC